MKFLQLKAIMSQIFWKEMGPFPMLMAKNLFVFLWVECLMDPPNYLIRKIKSSRLVFCWMASGVVMYGIGYKEVHTSQVKSWTSEATPSATHSHLPNKWACQKPIQTCLLNYFSICVYSACLLGFIYFKQVRIIRNVYLSVLWPWI